MSGKDEDFAGEGGGSEPPRTPPCADKERFNKLKSLKQGTSATPLARQVEVLYLSYLEKQVDPSYSEDHPRRPTRLKRRSTPTVPTLPVRNWPTVKCVRF